MGKVQIELQTALLRRSDPKLPVPSLRNALVKSVKYFGNFCPKGSLKALKPLLHVGFLSLLLLLLVISVYNTGSFVQNQLISSIT